MVGQSENGKCGWTYNKKSKNKRHTSKHFANKKKICIYIYIYIFSIYQISGQQFSRVLIGSCDSEYPWLFTVLRTERKMVRHFAKVSEEEIKRAFFYSSDLVNTKTTIPLRVGEEWWIYTSTLRVSVYIHHYSPPLRGIVVYY